VAGMPEEVQQSHIIRRREEHFPPEVAGVNLEAFNSGYTQF